jgi:tight adherence protein B
MKRKSSSTNYEEIISENNSIEKKGTLDIYLANKHREWTHWMTNKDIHATIKTHNRVLSHFVRCILLPSKHWPWKYPLGERLLFLKRRNSLSAFSFNPLALSIAGLVSLITLLIGWETSGRWAWLSTRAQRRLQKAESPSLQDDLLSSFPTNSLQRKLLEAGLPWSALQFRLASIVIGLAGALLAWQFFVPGLPALVAGLMLAYAPTAYLNERALSRGLRIDEQLPVALSRIAAGLQAGRGLDQVLETTARSLPEGSPLIAELIKAAQDIRTGDSQEAMRRLAERSASPSLSNVAMLLESYLRAGGGQYAGVVSEAAMQIQRLISVRNHARAKAAQALQTARLIPLIMGGVLVMMARDPATAESFRTPLVQAVIAVTMGVMLLGFLTMRREIRRVV